MTFPSDLKPKLVSKTIEIRVYDCGIPEHRHRSEKGAIHCILKHNSKSFAERQEQKELYSIRNAKIHADRLAGDTYTVISKRYNISTGRARQIFMKEERMRRWNKDV